MQKRAKIFPLFFTLIVISGVAAYHGFGGKKSAVGAVDNPVDNLSRVTVVEVSGPGIKYGSYTFFSKLLTTGQLCATFYSDSRCREYIPDPKKVLSTGDAVHFPDRGKPLIVGKMAGDKRVTLKIPLDPNADSAKDLEAVPGIGPKTAEKIVKRRVEQGPFRTIDELQQFLGVRVSAPEYFRVDNPAINEGGN